MYENKKRVPNFLPPRLVSTFFLEFCQVYFIVDLSNCLISELTILLLMIFWLLACNNLIMLDINVAIISMTRPVAEEKSTDNVKSVVCPNTTLFRSEIQYEEVTTQNSTQVIR